MSPLRVHACAKFNLGLEVLGRRPDGFHEMRTVIQSLALSDVLDVYPAPSGLALECSDPSLPSGEENLVMRAARMLQEAFSCRKGARLRLLKRIPVQAGLGGGSADAAATLLALSRLWRLPGRPADLMPLAANLGSDVPFFLCGGTALGVGRGEEVYALPDAPRLEVVIALSPRGMPTARAYEQLDGRLTRANRVHTIQEIVQGIAEGKVGEGLLFNRFEEVSGQPEGDAAALRRALEKGGEGRLLLAGSGSAWLGLFSSREPAQESVRRMSHQGSRGILTHTLTRKDYWELTIPSQEKESLR
ncbi:MAG: 4-(cytidine 5'-diphospho)-2-C-methyl-D-erythritol kinase [Acidobacteriota bacterium]